MTLILSLILVLFLIAACSGLMRKHGSWFYVPAGILCTAACFLTAGGAADRITGWPAAFLAVLTKGGLAGAFFILVMFAGALPDDSAARKKLMPIRRQLSLLGSALALGHGLGYGARYFTSFFFHAADMRLSAALACLCSFVLLALLLPLWITSFISVRKKMKPAAWKKLQRLAYPFYALVYLHIVLFNWHGVEEGSGKSILTVISYTILFGLYLSMRLSKWAVHSKKTGLILPVQLGTLCLTALISSWCAFSGVPAGGSPESVQVYAAASGEAGMAEGGQTERAAGGAGTAEGGQTERADGEAASEKPDPAAPEAGENPGEKAGDNAGGSVSDEKVQTEITAGEMDDAMPWADGTYQGAGFGYNGRLKVAVTIEGGRIADVKLKSHVEDEPYITLAVEGVIPAIVENNSSRVDAVSSATTTSDAIMAAVEDALSKAAEN